MVRVAAIGRESARREEEREMRLIGAYRRAEGQSPVCRYGGDPGETATQH